MSDINPILFNIKDTMDRMLERNSNYEHIKGWSHIMALLDNDPDLVDSLINFQISSISPVNVIRVDLVHHEKISAQSVRYSQMVDDSPIGTDKLSEVFKKLLKCVKLIHDECGTYGFYEPPSIRLLPTTDLMFTYAFHVSLVVDSLMIDKLNDLIPRFEPDVLVHFTKYNK